MNLLDIDSEIFKDPIIDAFSFVYGEKYRDYISKKIKNTNFIFYYNIDGMESYVDYLKRCKEREFALYFLDEIGVSSCYDRNNYSQDFDSDTEQVLGSTISVYPFSKYRNRLAPLCAFDENNQEPEKVLQENRLKIINYLLQEKGKKISLDQLTSFMESNEYQEIYEKIVEYQNIYNDLLEKYYEWEKSLSPYLEFINKEKKRRTRIYQEKKDELFSTIYPHLPEAVKNSICDKDFAEQEKIVLGNQNIDFPTLIESFSKTHIDKISDPNGDVLKELGLVSSSHRDYLNSLNILLPFSNLFYCDTEEKVISYLDFFKEEKIQAYIPNQDTITLVEKVRKEKEEKANAEYLYGRSDYQKIAIKFFYFPALLNAIRLIIKKQEVCVSTSYIVNPLGDICPILCYSIRDYLAGALDYVLLHEGGHAIDLKDNGCGLEPNYTFIGESWRNPYDKRFRIYEKIRQW